jgi:hypothetical protein
MDENEKFRESLRKQNPHIFETISNIKEDKSIRLKRLQILNMPIEKEPKEKMWNTYIKSQYDRGLLTSDEYFSLRDWKLE